MSLSLYNRTLPSAEPGFDCLARVYRWMEWLTFGPFLSRCRNFFLNDLKYCRRALVLGDGDGRFTARLLAHNPEIRVDAVDGSASMLSELLRRTGSDRSRVAIRRADLRGWTPRESAYDLVVTHFLLDCLSPDEVALLVRRVRPRISPHAVWLVSEFRVPAGWFGHIVARPLIRFLYWSFGLLTGLKVRCLPDHDKELAGAGFALKREHHSLCGLLVSQIWESSPNHLLSAK